MLMSRLTNSEMVLHMDNAPELTDTELELTDRLRTAMDEITDLEDEIRLLRLPRSDVVPR